SRQSATRSSRQLGISSPQPAVSRVAAGGLASGRSCQRQSEVETALSSRESGVSISRLVTSSRQSATRSSRQLGISSPQPAVSR
ncbi:MAG: hypothetical protein KBB47_08400, partial [Bacteroidales bacterium]|nr:hypothetical protein [Bacteroidales bacterium]